jgi:quercetin dioxygenase-like cupin family protein
MSYYIVKEMAPQRPAEGVEMRVITGDKMTMVFFRLEPGAKIPEHSHPHEQMGTVLKGAIELSIDKDRKVVNEGNAYLVRSNVVHSGRCLESVSEVLEVFSPPREDYIRKD